MPPPAAPTAPTASAAPAAPAHASTPASGTAGGGFGDAAGGPPAADPARPAWTARHLDGIRDAIQRRVVYPSEARRMGWSGRALVRFRLLATGEVADVRVVSGTGLRALDEGAVEAVRRAAPLPAPPVAVEIVAPIAFDLED